MIEFSEIKHILSDGLMSFPVTDFDVEGNFDANSYQARLEWLMPYGARVLFAAGGTGEYFSLALSEYAQVVETAVRTCKDHTPIIAGAGGPTRTAIAYAKVAQEKGAAGILLMPHYMTDAPQEGIKAHIREVCESIQIGVVLYHRGRCQLDVGHLEELADECPNLIGYKDGVGDIEKMVSVRQRLGNRFSYLGGLPTAEIFAQAYRAMGVPVYSSAAFNFVPSIAANFYAAVRENDDATVGDLLNRFFLPLIAIRNRKPGYAVSMIKSGVRLIGRSAGSVRAPLTDLAPEEERQLRQLIESVS